MVHAAFISHSFLACLLVVDLLPVSNFNLIFFFPPNVVPLIQHQSDVDIVVVSIAHSHLQKKFIYI